MTVLFRTLLICNRRLFTNQTYNRNMNIKPIFYLLAILLVSCHAGDKNEDDDKTTMEKNLEQGDFIFMEKRDSVETVTGPQR